MDGVGESLPYFNIASPVFEIPGFGEEERFQENAAKKKDERPQRATSSRVDPSFKSKRYRDKLRTEVKALEALLPVDRSSLHRKLDSQTVFRLVISYLRTKLFFAASGISSEVKEQDENKEEDAEDNLDEFEIGQQLLSALDGFLLVVTSDGTILYVSRNISQSLGFNQVDLMHRCMYGIVHPDDHHELKMVLEHSLDNYEDQQPCCHPKSEKPNTCRSVSFLCRVKCFNGTSTGYLVLFAFCRPFIGVNTDASQEAKSSGFWTKHELDLRFRQMDARVTEATGYTTEQLEGSSLYAYIHPEDLVAFCACHRALMRTEEIQTMYFRFQTQDGAWVWLHTRGKVAFKNSKKYSIVFTHCPVREEDSTYIQQEVTVRRRYAMAELMASACGLPTLTNDLQALAPGPAIFSSICEDDDNRSSYGNGGLCPSSWHTSADRHSPVFPSTHLPHRFHSADRLMTSSTAASREQQEAGPLGARDHGVYPGERRRLPSSPASFSMVDESPLHNKACRLMDDTTYTAAVTSYSPPVYYGYSHQQQQQQPIAGNPQSHQQQHHYVQQQQQPFDPSAQPYIQQQPQFYNQAPHTPHTSHTPPALYNNKPAAVCVQRSSDTTTAAAAVAAASTTLVFQGHVTAITKQGMLQHQPQPQLQDVTQSQSRGNQALQPPAYPGWRQTRGDLPPVGSLLEFLQQN